MCVCARGAKKPTSDFTVLRRQPGIEAISTGSDPSVTNNGNTKLHGDTVVSRTMSRMALVLRLRRGRLGTSRWKPRRGTPAEEPTRRWAHPSRRGTPAKEPPRRRTQSNMSPGRERRQTPANGASITETTKCAPRCVPSPSGAQKCLVAQKSLVGISREMGLLRCGENQGLGVYGLDGRHAWGDSDVFLPVVPECQSLAQFGPKMGGRRCASRVSRGSTV